MVTVALSTFHCSRLPKSGLYDKDHWVPYWRWAMTSFFNCHLQNIIVFANLILRVKFRFSLLKCVCVYVWWIIWNLKIKKERNLHEVGSYTRIWLSVCSNVHLCLSCFNVFFMEGICISYPVKCVLGILSIFMAILIGLYPPVYLLIMILCDKMAFDFCIFCSLIFYHIILLFIIVE